MTQCPDNPAAPFKKALAEATRTMADVPNLTVTYPVGPPGIRAPQCPPLISFSAAIAR